jgi:hypothetical protein
MKLVFKWCEFRIYWCGLRGLFEWTVWFIGPEDGWVDLGVVVVSWDRRVMPV